MSPDPPLVFRDLRHSATDFSKVGLWQVVRSGSCVARHDIDFPFFVPGGIKIGSFAPLGRRAFSLTWSCFLDPAA